SRGRRGGSARSRTGSRAEAACSRPLRSRGRSGGRGRGAAPSSVLLRLALGLRGRLDVGLRLALLPGRVGLRRLGRLRLRRALVRAAAAAVALVVGLVEPRALEDDARAAADQAFELQL